MKAILFISVLLLVAACEESDNRPFGKSDDQWLIQKEELTGLFSTNAFPNVTEARYGTVESQIGKIHDDDMVFIHSDGVSVWVFPHMRLGFEVLNEKLGDALVAINYCPITESGMAWNRVHQDDTLTFSASGFLYRDNLVAYDVEYETMWSQMMLRCINGRYISESPELFHLLETKWKLVKAFFPDAIVFDKPVLKSFSSQNNAVINDNRVYAIVPKFAQSGVKPNTRLGYAVSNMNGSIQILNESSHLIIGSSEYDFVTGFENPDNIKLSAITNRFPIIASDEKGNLYTIFGIIVDGPDQGKRLKSAQGYVAKYWAWKLFNPSLSRYSN